MPPKRKVAETKNAHVNIPSFDFCKYKVNNLPDLIKMVKDYTEYSTNETKSKKNKLDKVEKKIHKLPLILDDLITLDNLIGLHELKTQLVFQIIYYIGENEHMLMHTAIYGPPGSGKTTIGNIMASIYSKLGILKENKFRMIYRSDLIGQFLGETTLKTLKTLNSCKNGVFFLDEVYSLGDGSKTSTDSYAKEAVDTINQYLLEHQHEIICIIAGYKDEVEKCFFSKNAGLKRRFPWEFTIQPYSVTDLVNIFYNRIGEWKLNSLFDKIKVTSLFEKYKKLLVNSGGDINIILQFAKIKQVNRYIGIENDKIFSEDDIKYAFEKLEKNRKPVDDFPFWLYT